MPVAALKAALKDHVCCTACGCDALFHWKKGGALCSHCSNEYLHLISVTISLTANGASDEIIFVKKTTTE